MKVRMTFLPSPLKEEAFDFEDFKKWTEAKKKQWLKEHPDSKFAQLLGLRRENRKNEPQQPIKTREQPRPAVKTKQELMKERLAAKLEQRKQGPHKQRQRMLRSLHKGNDRAKQLRTKLKKYAQAGKSRKISPKAAKYVAERSRRVADELEVQRNKVHAALLRHMARELRKAGIEPRKLKRGSLRAGTIAYVGNDPKVAKVWDTAKARLKELPDFKMWHDAGAHLKSLRKAQTKYELMAHKS